MRRKPGGLLATNPAFLLVTTRRHAKKGVAFLF